MSCFLEDHSQNWSDPFAIRTSHVLQLGHTMHSFQKAYLLVCVAHLRIGPFIWSGLAELPLYIYAKFKLQGMVKCMAERQRCMFDG